MQLIPTENEAISHLVSDVCPPIPVIGTEAIRETFDAKTLQQTLNSRSGPGVTDVMPCPMPVRSLKLAMDFLARQILGC